MVKKSISEVQPPYGDPDLHGGSNDVYPLKSLLGLTLVWGYIVEAVEAGEPR